MDNRQQRTLESFQRDLVFIDQHPVTPEPPLLAAMRKSLRASITRINSLASDQRSAKDSISGHVDARVRKLRRDHMMPLVRIAKPLLAFAPGVEAALRVPHARSDAYTVAMAALRMADAVTPHAKLLLSAGYSKDYLKQFRHEARQLGLVVKSAESARLRRNKATAAIAAEFEKAKKTVTVIEGLVMLHHGSDSVWAKHWKDRRRVSKRIGRPRSRGKKLQPLQSSSAAETSLPA
jgi:hypothetical protein